MKSVAPALILSLLLLSLGVGAAPDTTRFNGNYRHAAADNEVADIESAIETALKEMSRLVRPIARPRLRNVTRAWEHFTIKIEAGQLHFLRPGRPDFVAPLDGTTAEWLGDDDKSYQASFILNEDGNLTQQISAEDGGRSQLFILTGDQLTVKTSVTSPKLKTPLTYQRSYRLIPELE